MIAMIGSGPHNLTALAFLLKADPALRSEVVVFDPSGRWLSRWDDQMRAQEIVHLRSSSVHHPDPDPLALRRFAQGRSEFFPPYDLPGTGLFRDFCQDIIDRYDLAPLVKPFSVERLEPSRNGLTLVVGGREMEARAVIVALGGGDPLWPSGLPNPQSPSLLHSDQVDLPTLEPGPGRILVVGGGLTAGHLALGALQRGWDVDLVARHPLRYKLFDAAPGWIGPKFLASYLREPNWSTRRRMVAQARGGGAMTEEIRKSLAPYRRSRRLRIHNPWPLVSLKRSGGGWIAGSTWNRSLSSDRVWLSTGYRLNLVTHPLFQTLNREFPLAVFDGLPLLDEDCRWPELPLYLMGMPAALRVGPAARNLPGARQAASLIARSLTGIMVPPI